MQMSQRAVKAMVPAEKETPQKPQSDGVTGEKLELIRDSSFIGADMADVIRAIARKHPEKFIGQPYQEKVRFNHLGWKMLKIVDGGNDVEEVKTLEEAERTTKTVLAWRDIEVHKIQTKADEDRRRQFNDFQKDESNRKLMADRLNQQLGLKSGTIVADSD